MLGVNSFLPDMKHAWRHVLEVQFRWRISLIAFNIIKRSATMSPEQLLLWEMDLSRVALSRDLALEATAIVTMWLVHDTVFDSSWVNVESLRCPRG